MNKKQHQQLHENLFKIEASGHIKCKHDLPQWSCYVCNDTRGTIDGLSGEEEAGALKACK